jgi:hypothetical protein
MFAVRHPPHFCARSWRDVTRKNFPTCEVPSAVVAYECYEFLFSEVSLARALTSKAASYRGGLFSSDKRRKKSPRCSISHDEKATFSYAGELRAEGRRCSDFRCLSRSTRHGCREASLRSNERPNWDVPPVGSPSVDSMSSFSSPAIQCRKICRVWRRSAFCGKTR